MRTYQSLLVGMHFRPPAKAVLEALPAGAPLVLDPEEDNPYDQWALRVSVRPEAVPEGQIEGLREACGLMGADWDELALTPEPIMLGYVISAGNKKLGAWTPNTVLRDVIAGGEEWEASLGFSPQGEPLVQVIVKDTETEGEDNPGEVQP